MTLKMIDEFIDRVNILALFDHSGRAGNGFFLTIFDRHPEVLTCPWVHYIYSYLITEFGDSPDLDARRAHEFITGHSYFKYIFLDPDETLSRQLRKFGADPSSKIDRKSAREIFKNYLQPKDRISRKDLILAAYYSYAVAIGRDIERVKYVLVSDAVTLRYENNLKGASGKVIHKVINDFPSAKCISLVRDPRAVFASNRHQFVNSNGNMYGIAWDNYIQQFIDLTSRRLRMDGCVYLFWMVFCAAAARCIWAIKREYREHFITIRNEDLNRDFLVTLQEICSWLGIEFWDEWAKDDYAPTSVGSPWKGTGAYNSRYQTAIYGPLRNDPQEVADKITGPNLYVTRRWKKRLGKNEIKLIEILFREEMRELSYEFIFPPEKSRDIRGFILNLLPPFRGELPGLRWILQGRHIGKKEVLRRLFYLIYFPPFYVISRVILADLYLKGFFNNIIPEYSSRIGE